MSDSSREEQLFSAALARPAEDRVAFLAEACADDPALRQSIEALLAAHDRAPLFLDESPVTRPLAAVAEEKPGDRIGRYKLLQKIGEGGYGVVYLAEQTEPVRRRVAVKVIKLGMDTKAVIARFEAERQALAMMDHPNIAKVLDGGATENGRPYFVMELVRGIAITRYCDENELTTAQRIRLFAQVCHAIQHAHQKGIIHRDIKPSNILVALHDTEPVPKVIDFGIAKATQGRLTDQTLFTAFEQFIGTPAYTSPEQANLSDLDIDTRSDVYSLGVLLYELLTGRTPFDGKELARAGIEEIRRHIREIDPPRPSTRLSTMEGDALDTAARQRQTAAPKLIGLLRGDLDWIVMRCLEKDRRRRYETASDLARDLDRHLNDEPVTARPPTATYRLRKTIQRHKLAVTAISAVTLALITGLGVATWAFIEEKAARERAVVAEQRAISEAKKSEQVAQFLQAMLQGAGPSLALGRDTTLLREIVDQTAARLDNDLRDQPLIEAELRETLGRVYFDLGVLSTAENMHLRALELRKVNLGMEAPATARSLRFAALAKSALGDQSEAEAMLRNALSTQKKLLGNSSIEVAETMTDLASILLLSRDYTHAESEQRTALELYRRYAGSRPFAFAKSLSELALSVRERGDLKSAEAMAREALALQRKLRGKEHPDVARALLTLAQVLHSRGITDEAEQVSREALAIQRTVLGNDHPDVAQTLQSLCSILYLQWDFHSGEALVREALTIQSKLGMSDSPQFATSLRLLAYTLYARLERAKAAETALSAMEIQKQCFGTEHIEYAETASLLALIYALQGKASQAEKIGREAFLVRAQRGETQRILALRDLSTLVAWQGEVDEPLEISREIHAALRLKHGPNDVLTLVSALDMAVAVWRSGDSEAAIRIAEDAFESLYNTFGFKHAMTFKLSWLLARLYHSVGRTNEAINLLESASERSEPGSKFSNIGVRLRTSLGMYYSAVGRVDDAELILARDADWLSTTFGNNDPMMTFPLKALVEVYLGKKSYKRAETCLQQLQRIEESKLGGDIGEYVVWIYLGEALKGQGKFTQAESSLLRAYKFLSEHGQPVFGSESKWLARTMEGLADLYTQSGQDAEAVEWKARLSATHRVHHGPENARRSQTTTVSPPPR